jgi:hypothetical protein
MIQTSDSKITRFPFHTHNVLILVRHFSTSGSWKNIAENLSLKICYNNNTENVTPSPIPCTSHLYRPNQAPVTYGTCAREWKAIKWQKYSMV